jgi:hypothetical protein
MNTNNTNFNIIINNKEIFEFYQKYPLDFEQMNLLFISLLQEILNTADNSFNSNISNTILSKINNIESLFNKQEHDLTTKLNEHKKDYINDIKLILLSNNVEHITPLIKETNNNLIDKTTNIFNELLPKNQNILSKDIENNFKILQNYLTNETNKLLSASINPKTIDDFINNSNNAMTQTLSTLTTIISSTETRIDNKLNMNNTKIDELQKYFHDNNNTQILLQKNVTEMLKKFEKGSGKGNVSENVLYNILLALFPCAQIDYVGNEVKETGDIMFERKNKHRILIENKDHDTCNVPKTDVEKFIRDCEIQNCCGIMFSQNRGIANKENFELQINHGNILLYVHNTNFDSDKIKTAIEIVEHFKNKLDEINSDIEGYTIETTMLEDINKEFNTYVTQKHNMLKLIKDFNDKINLAINELKLPNLEQYLSKNFATSANQGENICKYCEKFVAKSLSQHFRYCSAKKSFDESTDFSNIEINTPITSNPTININSNPNPKKRKSKTKTDTSDK